MLTPTTMIPVQNCRAPDRTGLDASTIVKHTTNAAANAAESHYDL